MFIRKNKGPYIDGKSNSLWGIIKTCCVSIKKLEYLYAHCRLYETINGEEGIYNMPDLSWMQ